MRIRLIGTLSLVLVIMAAAPAMATATRFHLLKRVYMREYPIKQGSDAKENVRSAGWPIPRR